MSAPETEQEYVAQMTTSHRAQWAFYEALWDAARGLVAAMQADTGRQSDLIVPAWKDLTFDQKISFEMSCDANEIPFKSGSLVAGVVILTRG